MSNRQPGIGYGVLLPPHVVIRQAIKLITGRVGLVKDLYILVYRSHWPSIENF